MKLHMPQVEGPPRRCLAARWSTKRSSTLLSNPGIDEAGRIYYTGFSPQQAVGPGLHTALKVFENAVQAGRVISWPSACRPPKVSRLRNGA